jgi:hypothetical protein
MRHHDQSSIRRPWYEPDIQFSTRVCAHCLSIIAGDYFAKMVAHPEMILTRWITVEVGILRRRPTPEELLALTMYANTMSEVRSVMILPRMEF